MTGQVSSPAVVKNRGEPGQASTTPTEVVEMALRCCWFARFRCVSFLHTLLTSTYSTPNGHTINLSNNAAASTSRGEIKTWPKEKTPPRGVPKRNGAKIGEKYKTTSEGSIGSMMCRAELHFYGSLVYGGWGTQTMVHRSKALLQ